MIYRWHKMHIEYQTCDVHIPPSADIASSVYEIISPSTMHNLSCRFLIACLRRRFNNFTSPSFMRLIQKEFYLKIKWHQLDQNRLPTDCWQTHEPVSDTYPHAPSYSCFTTGYYYCI